MKFTSVTRVPLRLSPLNRREQELVEKYMHVVDSIFNYYKKRIRHEYQEDYKQAGYLSLIKAVKISRNKESIGIGNPTVDSHYQQFLWMVVNNDFKAKMLRDSIANKFMAIGLPENYTESLTPEINPLVHEMIEDFLRTLTKEEQRIIKLRFGIGCNPHTLKELKKEVGINMGELSKIIQRIFGIFSPISLNKTAANRVSKEPVETPSEPASIPIFELVATPMEVTVQKQEEPKMNKPLYPVQQNVLACIRADAATSPVTDHNSGIIRMLLQHIDWLQGVQDADDVALIAAVQEGGLNCAKGPRTLELFQNAKAKEIINKILSERTEAPFVFKF